MTDQDKKMLARSYELNMPHMALGGLSEAWLFRELGDSHWTMISDGLRAPSGQMADANGDRLYATFTRIRLTSSQPLSAYDENDHVDSEATLSRFGGGVYFGTIEMRGPKGGIKAELMSSFTKRSAADSNLSLLKGQPVLPDDCPIPVLPELPPIAQQYRQVRAAAPEATLFEHLYSIMPYHDINGVGLLYFAAYPTINDLSEMRHFATEDWCIASSTLSRDVHYYGNCEMHDSIVYRLHAVDEKDGKVTLDSSLSRASDGTMIARIFTTKAVGLG